MNIEKHILTQNPCYKIGKKIIPKGIMVHSTGANNPNLSRYIPFGHNPNSNHWNQSSTKVCVHGFIGKDIDGNVRVYQTLPWNIRGWHCNKGKNGSGNDTYISFEICEDNLTDKTYFEQVYNCAVELCAYLCKIYKFNPYKQIICHSEGHKLGIASNHADVMHWFPRHGKSMNIFRDDVALKIKGEPDMTYDEVQKIVTAELNKALTDKGIQEANREVSSWANDTWMKYTKLGIFDGTRPRASITREEMSVILDRTKDIVFDKTEDIPKWGKPTVEKLVHKGYLDGTGDGFGLTYDLLRILVINDRAGLYGE